MPEPTNERIDDLAALVAKEATYDGYPNEYCPHCNAVLKRGYRQYDHQTVLASAIRSYLGLGPFADDKIKERIRLFEWPTDDKPPHRELARDVLLHMFA